MMRHRLEMQATRIEAVLQSHRISGYVSGGIILPRVVRFELVTSMGTRVRQVANLAEEIAMALGVRSARVYRNGGSIQVEVPRETPGEVRLLPLCRRLARIPPLTGVLGLDNDGVPLLIRLPSPDVVHIMIAGTSGSGKTALMRSLLLSLAMHNPQAQLQIVLLDPKGRGLMPLFHLPHLLVPPILDAHEAGDVLAWLVEEMERRDRECRDMPHIVVAVDELADLTEAGGGAVQVGIRRLAQRGREAGIHLIVATQKPVTAAVDTLAKANFPVRLVGAVTTPEEAKVATGLAGSGAEKLLGRGDFLLVTHGQTWRFQAAYVSRGEAERIVRALQDGIRPSRRWYLEEPAGDGNGRLLARARSLISGRQVS
ncbi:MAG: DNA translocase FtsK [Anaerolineae bacterium]|nr:DNA translocase FtsK [Anaerolineae bacterium]